MNLPNSQELNDLMVAQLAAESYLHRAPPGNPPAELESVLRFGNNNPAFFPSPTAPDLPGKTRMTDAQIARFKQVYDDAFLHLPNTWSGFSATLFRNRLNGEYVLSFRSTEYPNASGGGDWERDGGFNNAADAEISTHGFAVAQIADMEAFYRQLRAPGGPLEGQNFRVTGYSLGGHLATVFAEAHENEAGFSGAVTFNSPGRGAIGATGRTVGDIVEAAYAQLSAAGLLLRTEPSGSNIYDLDQYKGSDTQGAGLRASILSDFGFLPGIGLLSSGTPSNLADGKIAQVYGLADFDDSTWVANSGVHSSNYLRVFIEDQPASQGAGPITLLGRILGLWHRPGIPDTFDRWEDDIGGVQCKGRDTALSSSARR